MLSYRYRNSKVRCWDFGANGLISHHYFNADNGVLRAFSPLKEHVDVDVVDDVKLFLGGNDIIFFLGWWLHDSLYTFFRIFFAPFFSVRCAFGGSYWSNFLFFFLRAILLFNFWLFFSCMTTFFGGGSELFKFNSQICRIQVLT